VSENSKKLQCYR